MKLKDYFLASETNDYQPWILKPPAIFSFCLIVWGLRLFLPGTLTFASPGIDASDLMNRINQERTNRFLPSLQANAKLASAAASKSNDMLARSYFAHVDPDGNYVWYRIENAGYQPYLTLGENLAIDFSEASSVVEAWMNSPTHRANIVNEKFQDQGLASIYGLYEPGHYTIAITSLFGTLLKKTTPPPPEAVAKTQTPPPSSKPAPPPPVPKPLIPPPPPVVLEQKTEPKSEIKINPDIKRRIKIIGNDLVIELDVIISGNPAKALAQVKDKKVELLPSAITGQFLGVITFPKETGLSQEKITVSAASETGNQISAEFDLGDLPSRESNSPNPPLTKTDANFIKILKIIFSVFAAIYLIFLVIDSIIIHRAKINRTTIHSSPHSLLFLLIVLFNLVSLWV